MYAPVARDFIGPQSVSLVHTPLYGRWVLDRVRGHRSSFPLALSVPLPELDLCVHLQQGDLAQAIGANFVAAATSGRSQRLEIFVAHPDLAGIPKPATWTGPYVQHDVATLLDRARLRGSYFHDLDLWQFLDLDGGFGAQLMHSAAAYPPWEPAAPLRTFLHWHYAEQGMRLAHCGVLGTEGRGVLLAGAGGAGKSSTVAAGLMHGLQSTGDDYVLLRLDDDAVTAFPVFATLKQDSAGAARLGLIDRGGLGSLNWQGKHEFRLQDVAAGPTPAQLTIDALLVLRITGQARSRISPLPRREAMLAFAPSSIHQMPGERGSGFAFFSRVANRLPCYRLELGTDAAEIAGTIAEFLQRGRG